MKQGSVLLVATVCLLGLSGCSITGENIFAGEETGRFTLSADAEGLRAFGEAMNGLVVTGKAQPNQGDSYFITQQQRVEAKKFRYVKTNNQGGLK